MERRTLLKSLAASGLLAEAARSALAAGPRGDEAADPLPPLTDPGELRGEMLYRRLGLTGETVSAIGFGGSHFAKAGIAQSESINLCHAAIDRGITFMDKYWD